MRCLAALSLALLISACSQPLEIVGEGDILSASGERNCLLEDFQTASPNCTENFVVSNYLETYTAVPRSGWLFQGWQNYCAEAPLDTCSFSYEASTVRSFWGTVAPPLVAIFAQDNGIPMSEQVIANGRTWAQPDLFSGVTGEQIFAQCPQGICSEGASINGYSMNGWQLASVEDANALYNYFIDDDVLGPGPDNYSSTYGPNDLWGPRIFSAGFRPTLATSEIRGWIIEDSENPESSMKVGLITRSVVGEPAYARTSRTRPISNSADIRGAWFYRPSAPTDHSVILGSREWAQPRIFTTTSWQEVESACSYYSLMCDGSIKGIDVTGWQWASAGDALELLSSFGVEPPVRGEYDWRIEDNMGWYQNLEDAGFQTVFVTGDEKAIAGWTWEKEDELGDLAYSAFMTFEITVYDEDETEVFETETVGAREVETQTRSATRGVWLYRELP